MNELMFAECVQGACETLLALRLEASSHEAFYEMCKYRFSLSKNRSKLMCDFAEFRNLCRDENKPLPETPENVEPVLRMPKKKWLDTWEIVCSYNNQPTAERCTSTMQQFGINPNKRIPQHILDRRRVQRAASTLAAFEDGEKLADDLGPAGFGKDWDAAVGVTIEADQRRMDLSGKNHAKSNGRDATTDVGAGKNHAKSPGGFG